MMSHVTGLLLSVMCCPAWLLDLALKCGWLGQPKGCILICQSVYFHGASATHSVQDLVSWLLSGHNVVAPADTAAWYGAELCLRFACFTAIFCLSLCLEGTLVLLFEFAKPEYNLVLLSLLAA